MIQQLLTFLIIGKCVAGYIRDGKQFEDCSYKFRNRMASFEYHGSFVYPIDTGLYVIALTRKEADQNTIRTEDSFQWHFHETFNNQMSNDTFTPRSLYVESMEYPNYYLREQGWRHYVTLMYNDVADNKINIFCPQYCKPVRSENNTEYYESCHFHSMAVADYWQKTHQLFYADKGLDYKDFIFVTKDSDSNEDDDGRFDFSIVSPKTTTYWQNVDQIQNCNCSEPMPTSTIIRQSIVRTDGNSSLKENELKIGGRKALKFLELAPESSFSWQKVNIDEMIKSKEHVIGGDEDVADKLKPGYKRIVYQWIGEAAYFRLATDRVKMCDVPCYLSEASGHVEEYCHGQFEVHRVKNIEALKDIICHN